MGRVETPFRTLGGKPWLALLGVLAIAINCFVVQVHVHTQNVPLAAHVQTIDLDVGPDHWHADADHASHPAGVPAHKHGGQQTCYLCQTALASSAILSSALAVSFVERNFLENVVVAILVPTHAPRSHAWQSRAPPPQL